MTVEITSVTINETAIILEGTDLESFLFSDDLDAEIGSTKTFYFDRKAWNGAQMKYLYKLVRSQKICESEKTMSAKLMKLNGQILNLPGTFLYTEPEQAPKTKKKSTK